MNTAARVIYNHIYFFREGDAFTVPGAGTTSSTAKPDAADPAWIDMGLNESLGVEPKASVQEIWGAAPGSGKIVLQQVLETKQDLTFNLKCEQIPAIAFQAMFHPLATSITDGSQETQQYNPLAGDTIRGWMKVEQYDGEDNLVNVVDVWVHLKISGTVNFNDSAVKVDFVMRVMFSTLNTGALYPV